MPATYEPIATTTLGSAAASITFSSISSAYTDLYVVIVGRLATSNNDLAYQFNSDTGTNYSYTILKGSGTAASSNRVTNDSQISIDFDGELSSTVPFFASINVFSYAGSTNKTTLNSLSNDKNGSGSTKFSVGLWRNTNAITSIKILGYGANLASGTVATLYGILKA